MTLFEKYRIRIARDARVKVVGVASGDLVKCIVGVRFTFTASIHAERLFGHFDDLLAAGAFLQLGWFLVSREFPLRSTGRQLIDGRNLSGF